MMPFIALCPAMRSGADAGGRRNRDAETGAAIALRPDRLPPPAIVEIPGDGVAQPGRDAFARPPAEFSLDLCRIHRIAPVMAGAVLHEGDQVRVRPMRRLR